MTHDVTQRRVLEAPRILPFAQTMRQNVRQLRLTGWIVYLSNKIFSQNNLYYLAYGSISHNVIIFLVILKTVTQNVPCFRVCYSDSVRYSDRVRYSNRVRYSDRVFISVPSLCTTFASCPAASPTSCWRPASSSHSRSTFVANL